VESQQEQVVRAQASDKQVLTPEEREKRSRRGTLMLARARAAADLSRATTPAHRTMLERALADLDKQLRES
jgi:hypothetical protein